jgi:hypothetical protein
MMAAPMTDNSKMDARPAELRFPPEGSFKGLNMGMDEGSERPTDGPDIRRVQGEQEPVPMRTEGEPKAR